MYNQQIKNTANAIFEIVGGRKMQLFTKNNPSIILSLATATSFLPITANNIERSYCVIHDITQSVKCDDCNNLVKWDKSKRTYKQHCSRKCSSASNTRKEKTKQTLVDKYGVTNASNIPGIQQQKIDTCRKNHNVDFPQQSTNIRKKTFVTMQQNFNVDYPYQNKNINDSRKRTLMKNFGVDNPSKNDDIQKKKIKTNFEKYNQKHYNTSLISHCITFLENKDWLYNQHYVQLKPLIQIAKELNCCDGTVARYLHSHGLETQHFFQSAGERELSEFISSLNIDVITNTRSIIHPYELDIYIPSLNLAIEYCGLYWHSEQQGKDKHYHKNKYDLCKEKGIRLITMFEDEWLSQKGLTCIKLKNILKKSTEQQIYARKTNICVLSTKEKREFLDNYHIQGNGPGSINIGLEYDSTIVACMSFIEQKGQHYLNRYATSYRVPGGFSKLLKYFQNNYEWQQLISFADLRWSNGNLYEKTGWKLDSVLPPDYSYSPDGHNRFHKFNYRRKHLPKLLKHFDPSLSERENCDNNGILRIWDCGKLRYVINNS